MKTTSKILILVIGCFIAVAGILFFIKTILAPPKSLLAQNPYEKALNDEREDLREEVSFQNIRNIHPILSDKINRFRIEKAIDNNTADMYTLSLDSVYGKGVVQYSFHVFQDTQWGDNNVKDIQGMMATLDGRRLSNGQSTLPPELNGEFIRLKDIVARYNSALAASKNTSFKSISDASAKISQAESFLDEEYLKNNPTLMNDLRNVKSKLANSHYNYLAGRVKKLENYYSMSESSFYSLVRSIENEIDAYDSTGIYGGNKKNTNSLYSRINEISGWADNYFYYTPSYNYDYYGW